MNFQGQIIAHDFFVKSVPAEDVYQCCLFHIVVAALQPHIGASSAKTLRCMCARFAALIFFTETKNMKGKKKKKHGKFGELF